MTETEKLEAKPWFTGYLTEHEAEQARCKQYVLSCGCDVRKLHGRNRLFIGRLDAERAYYEMKGRGCTVSLRRRHFYRIEPNGHEYCNPDFTAAVSV